MPNELFDKEQIYDEQIHPLMEEIIAICEEHNIPFVATFVYNRKAENEGGDGYVTTFVCKVNPMPKILAGFQHVLRLIGGL